MYVFVSVCFNLYVCLPIFSIPRVNPYLIRTRVTYSDFKTYYIKMSNFDDSRRGLTWGISTKCVNLKVDDPRNSLIRITHFIRTVCWSYNTTFKTSHSLCLIRKPNINFNFSNTIESLAFKNSLSKYEFLGQLRTWVEKRLVEKIKNGKKIKITKISECPDSHHPIQQKND